MEKTLKNVLATVGLCLVAAFALTAPASAQRRATSDTDTAQAAPSDAGVVNIQTATADQLQLLPGIGPSKAAAIVAYREAHPFHRVEDIMRVRGIGRATFRRLRPMISVSGSTTMTTEVSLPHAPRGSGEAEADDEASE